MIADCIKLQLDVPNHAAGALSDVLQEHGLVVRLFPAIREKQCRIEVYGPGETDPNYLRSRLVEDAARFGVRDAVVDVVWLPATDWLAENQRSFAPQRVGRFYIHDSAHRDRIPVNALPLLVDAATAFGTGAHESTRACLDFIASTSRGPRRDWPQSVLDMGCGSGILGIAAATALKSRVFARDVDSEAIRVTRQNCRRNGVSHLVDVKLVRESPFAPHSQRFDLVLANILAEPLVRLAPDLCRVLASGGNLILAGMLEPQGQRVLRVYFDQGLRLVRRITSNGWLALVLSRPKDSMLHPASSFR